MIAAVVDLSIVLAAWPLWVGLGASIVLAWIERRP